MTRALWIAVGVLGVATTALAQPPAPGPVTIAAGLTRAYNNVKLNLTEEAAKMPEADYGFKPGPAPELRNFGMLFGHVANAQFGSCAASLGQPNPNQGHDQEKEATTKDAIVKALADSFALCDKAFAALTDQSALEMVRQGQGESARTVVLANLIAHSNEMYGTASVYMRAKGLVPPSTERQMQGRGRGAAPGR